MKYAVIYARFSCDKQNEQSIEGQLRICNQYAQANGLTVVDTYIDRATTGTNDNRAALQKMLSDCTKNVPWSVVLVYAIDRFGRDSIEIAVNKQKLKKNKKTFISATQRTSENLDGTKNLDGILLENMYIGLAEYYSAELSQKVTRGMQESRRKGQFTGGPIPFGYKVINKKVYPHEETSKIVLYIFQKYATGTIAKDIALDLNEKGITNNGKAITKKTILKLIHNKKYIGIHSHGDEVYTNIYPAIIPMDLYEKVQRVIALNGCGRRSENNLFLLRGKLFCGLCGAKINGESGTSQTGERKHYYKCSTKKDNPTACEKTTYRQADIENIVLSVTHSLLCRYDNLEIIANEIVRLHNQKTANSSVINLLNTDKNSTQKGIDNLMKAIEEGIITSSTKKRLSELENKLSEIEDKIAIEKCKLEKQLKKEDVIKYIKTAIKKEALGLVQLLIRKIVAYEDRLEIYYNFTLDEEPDRPNAESQVLFLPDKKHVNVYENFFSYAVNI